MDELTREQIESTLNYYEKNLQELEWFYGKLKNKPSSVMKEGYDRLKTIVTVLRAELDRRVGCECCTMLEDYAYKRGFVYSGQGISMLINDNNELITKIDGGYKALKIAACPICGRLLD